MLRLLYVSLVLATAASAQAPDAVPARRGTTQVLALSGGVASNGPAARLVLGNEFPVAPRVSVGLVGRLAGSRGAYAPARRPDAAADDTYLEVGPSLRPSWRVTDRLEVAGSAGVAGAAIFATPQSRFDLGVPDFGFTVPLEAEVTARLGRRIGVSVAASRSVAVTSYRNAPSTAVAPYGDGYSLGQWTTTVGLRIGR